MTREERLIVYHEWVDRLCVLLEQYKRPKMAHPNIVLADYFDDRDNILFAINSIEVFTISKL